MLSSLRKHARNVLGTASGFRPHGLKDRSELPSCLLLSAHVGFPGARSLWGSGALNL